VHPAAYADRPLAGGAGIRHIRFMVARVTPLPARGAVFFDVRDDGQTDRMMRVSWRPEVGVFVFSIWHDDRCVSTFQLAKDELPGLLSNLVSLVMPQTEATGESATG
jgi:hypothetical protein